MADDQHSMDNAQEHHASKPGLLLRKAREAKKLTQGDVAKQMRLSLQWVKDIENDDYKHLPAPIYARGYLRAYARLVDCSPDEVVAAFDQFGFGDLPEEAKPADVKMPVYRRVPVMSKSRRRISRKTLRWLTAGMLGVLVVIAGVWWQGANHSGRSGSHQVAIQSAEKPSTDISATAVPVVEVATPTNKPAVEAPAQKPASAAELQLPSPGHSERDHHRKTTHR